MIIRDFGKYYGKMHLHTISISLCLCVMQNIGHRTTEKLRKLSKFIEEKHGMTLARAISENPAKIADILSGKESPTRKICAKVAAYFFIPVDIIIDDAKDLPELDQLKVDEDLLSIQRNDLENNIEREKQKHFFSRNWRMIGYRKRVSLVL